MRAPLPQEIHEEACGALLASLNLGRVVREPNGPSTFPDFQLGDAVFAEATLLAEHLDDGQSPVRNSSSVRHSLFSELQKRFANLDSTLVEQSTFIDVEIYGRPICGWNIKRLGQIIEEDTLRLLSKGFVRMSCLNGRGELTLHQGKSAKPSIQLMALTLPSDTGWIADDLLLGVRDALSRKTPKLRGLKSSTQGLFWLLLGGTMTLGLSKPQIDFMRNDLGGIGPWDDIAFVNPIDPRRSQFLIAR